jgi:hypothetical protein
MDRSTRRRLSLPRLLALALVAGAYLATLVWASDISAVDAASSVHDAVVNAGSAASGQVSAATSATASTLQGASPEAPMTTLAIAGVALAVGGAWLAVRAIQSHRPFVRRARLVARYLTTLI